MEFEAIFCIKIFDMAFKYVILFQNGYEENAIPESDLKGAPFRHQVKASAQCLRLGKKEIS